MKFSATSALGVVVTAALLTGCNAGGTSADGATRASPTAQSTSALPALRPAAEAAPHTDATLGRLTALDPQTDVLFRSYQLQTSAVTRSDPQLVVNVRVENLDTRAHSFPKLGVLCANSSRPSGLWVGGQLDTTQPLPSRSFAEGSVNVVLVGDHFSGDDSRNSCVAPAYLVAQSQPAPADPPHTVRIALPAGLVGQMNKAVAEANAANDH